MRVVQSDLVRERPLLTKHYDSSNLNQLENKTSKISLGYNQLSINWLLVSSFKIKQIGAEV